MTQPLEILDPKTYGGFDSGQLTLINKLNAYDLVLIENATELFREVMHDHPENLEKMLRLIVQSAKSECVYVNSETFPYYLSPETIANHSYRKPSDSKVSEKMYMTAVRRYKKNHLPRSLLDNNCVITIFAADLGDAGGHYSAYIWTPGSKQLTIFDSMSTARGTSYYYPYFHQLGKDIFGTPKELVVPCVKGLLSLQATGGFPGHTPEATERAFDDIIQSQNFPDLEDPYFYQRMATYKHYIAMQSTESQNHFCYMWSIWFIHALVSGYTLEELTKAISINEVDPLYVIKRYSWGMFNLSKLSGYLKHKNLFDTYFPRVWYAKPDTVMPTAFIPYALQMPVCTNVDDCLIKSISPAVLTRVPFTPVPSNVKAITTAVANQTDDYI